MKEQKKSDQFDQKFVLVRKNKTYTSNDRFPKISIRRELYEELASAANESGLSMSELAGQAIRYALDRLEWVEE